jgi:hypothetical protein
MCCLEECDLIADIRAGGDTHAAYLSSDCIGDIVAVQIRGGEDIKLRWTQ